MVTHRASWSPRSVTEDDFLSLQDQVDEQASKIDELEQAMENAGTIDLNDLQDSYDTLQADHDTLASTVDGLVAEVDGLGRGQQQLTADLAALTDAVVNIEDSFGNDYWFTSAAPSTTLSTSTSWSDLSGASEYVSLDKPGAVAVWGQVSGSTTCGHNIRAKIQSTSSSWEDTTEEVDLVTTTYASAAEATVFGIFDPGEGDYEVAIQSEAYSTSSGSCTIQAYSLAVIQMGELM